MPMIEAPMPSSTVGHAVRRTSALGSFAIAPLRRVRAKSSDSSTFNLVNSPATTSIPDRRNGSRQPHEANAASSIVPTARNSTVDKIVGHQHGPTPLAADADALQRAQQRQAKRRGHADLGVGRQHPDEEGRHSHHHQRGRLERVSFGVLESL